MITSIYPISDLRRRTREIFERLENNEKVFITRNGRCIGVLISMETYNQEVDEDKRNQVRKELLEIEKELELTPDSKHVRKSLSHLRKE